MLIRNTSDWKIYISTAMQRGWPLGMFVQSIPRGIVSSEGVENYGNTSVAMAEDVGFEHGQQNEDGHTDLGVAVVGHGASGNAHDEEGNGRRHEVEEQAYEGPGSQAEPQGHEEEGYGSQAEAQGLADEGERIPSIVQQMQNEDDEFAQAQKIGEGSDEDEDYPIPGEWREHGFGNPVVHDAKQQEWKYRENEEAVKLWSLSLKKEFKVVKSTQSVYDVCRVSEGCPWRLHAYKGIMKTHWKVSIITEHTCYNREVPKYNRNLTAALVANEMYDRILDAPHFEPKQIIREMELQHQYTISYAKAYRAKQKVFEMRFGTYEDSYDNLPRMLATIGRRFGTYEDSYDNLPRMLATIAQRNPGTYYDVMHFPNPEGGPSILQRVFFCLGPCVRAFQYCLPLLCIDGTFLTGKYKGTILTAIGVDGNNQVLPVAFAFVENENADSWYWFLERVKTNVVSSRSNVCLISDRHSGILDAIEKLKHGNGASPPLWPDVHSRWCMRHLATNFYDHFKNKDLQDLFKSLCSQNQQQKFNAIWKLLDELTAKHQAATSSASSSGRTAKSFSQWIQDKPKEKWALLYDTNGRRYGIMTTNYAERYNMVMRSSRGIPLVGVVEFILYGCAKYFRERYMSISADLSNASVLFGRTITKYMETKTDKAQIHNARLLGTRENRFEVSCRDRSRRGVRRERTVQETVIGNDGTAHCSCMKPTLLHLPCSHVLAACRELSVDPTNFVSTFYTKGAIAATWNQELFGYGMVRAYTAPNEQKWYIPNPALKRLKGRRQTRRIRNGMDEAEAGKCPKQCTQCGAVGHNYKKCPENAFPAAAEAGPSGNATDGMAEEPPTPEPLDSVVDSGHRSYMSAMEHKHLATFQCRPLKSTLSLTTVGWSYGRHGRGRPRLMIDNSLITALVDRWRPETHTFHVPYGEMAPTLQDVSYLLGLPIAGDRRRAPCGPGVVEG
ncbi:hypothetical protein U9M48_015737 [Paspalum notatum var. saurae]|uniref:Mutator-like transposase n=1 Tax=Paspalum notatum var. saurae TaxID=547442 RepID=A0AAQ3T5F9_PASNO